VAIAPSSCIRGIRIGARGTTKGLAFNAYRTLLGAAKIAEAVARFTRAPAKFAATWREADRW